MAAVLALLAVLALGLTRLAASRLHDAVLAALGPRATLDAIELGWRGVELRGLRIAAARGWPAKDELRAARVLVVPDLLQQWRSGAWRVRRIDVEGGYLSLHRTRDGKLKLLPALLDGRAGSGGAGVPLHIGSVVLRGAAIDFHDGSLARGGTHRLQLTALDADVGPLALPALDQPVTLDIAAQLEGPRHDGRLRVSGRLTPATRDAALDVSARGVDLVALQPYLLKAGDAGVQRGRLDLTLQAGVQQQRLRAPGRITLVDLELSSGGGLLGSLAGVPRQAVLSAMQREGRIELAFTLEGRLDDPRFSINENLLARVSAGLAESLGVSVSGIVEGVGSVIKGLVGR